MRRLKRAVSEKSSYAFETTLGGSTIPAEIRRAAPTHDVHMWYCGLSSPELHLARVRARVHAGGHDIPQAKIRERYEKSVLNLIALLPVLSHLQVYDNSRSAGRDGKVPDPILLLEWQSGRMTRPSAGDIQALRATPAWARPAVEAALRFGSR